MKGKKKIAYSPSRGATGYTIAQEKEFLKLISDFDFLSAREKSFQEYISRITGREIPLVLDPVLLNDVSYYREMMFPPESVHMPEKKYLLIYIVMERPTELVREACEFALKNDLQIIELGQYLEHADLVEGVRHSVVYDIGIEEWLWYLDHAEYIFTNSFHACCFSILMHKQFFAGDRSGDKIDSVLEVFQLSWRRLLSAERDSDRDRAMKLEDINYDAVEAILQEQRTRSADYILGAIRTLEQREHQPILPNVNDILAEYPDTPPDPPETVISLDEQEIFEKTKIEKIKYESRMLTKLRRMAGKAKRKLRR